MTRIHARVAVGSRRSKPFRSRLAATSSRSSRDSPSPVAFLNVRTYVLTVADIEHGKPAPDIYIEAARRIGVDPKRCRAYEDGETGLLSAHRAGCHVIDVTHMDRYPMVEGLRLAKATAEAERSWLP